MKNKTVWSDETKAELFAFTSKLNQTPFINCSASQREKRAKKKYSKWNLNPEGSGALTWLKAPLPGGRWPEPHNQEKAGVTQCPWVALYWTQSNVSLKTIHQLSLCDLTELERLCREREKIPKSRCEELVAQYSRIKAEIAAKGVSAVNTVILLLSVCYTFANKWSSLSLSWWCWVYCTLAVNLSDCRKTHCMLRQWQRFTLYFQQGWGNWLQLCSDPIKCICVCMYVWLYIYILHSVSLYKNAWM